MSLWSRSLSLVALLGLSASGCGFDGHRDHHPDWMDVPGEEVPQNVEPQEVAIDADALLEAKPGEGVAVMVEYATGGRWRVFTSCDYNADENPGQACRFDVFAKVLDEGRRISNATGQELSGKDNIQIQADGTAHLYTENTLSLTGLTFDTAPGATLELDVYLDAVQDPHLIYWVGDGVLHQGAPTDPLRFVPSEAPADPTKPGTDGNPAP